MHLATELGLFTRLAPAFKPMPAFQGDGLA